MIGFFLKKNFCDGWDNVFYLIVPNIVLAFYAAVATLLLRITLSLETSFALSITCGTFIILFAVAIVLCAAFSQNAESIANFSTPSNSEYFKQIPKSFSVYFRFGLLQGLLLVVGFIGIPVYFSMGGVLGFALAIVVLSAEIVFFLSLQWFIPLQTLLHDDFKKCLKKCFIIFFDNTAFSVFMFLHNLVLSAISPFIFLVIPGGAGIVLSQVNALRLRLYKYDWLDANPQYKNAKYRKNIPWDDLIKNDRETLGPRSFKSFFMPWKE